MFTHDYTTGAGVVQSRMNEYLQSGKKMGLE